MKGTKITTIIQSLISTLLLFLLTGCFHAQNQQHQQQNIKVPSVVDNAFKSKYSDIPRTWQKYHYGYEATFLKDNIKYEAEFSETGEWLETEYYVTEKDFPSAVLKRIKEIRPQFIITKYEIEITPQGIFYEVDITDGEIEEELYFDYQGNPHNDLYED